MMDLMQAGHRIKQLRKQQMLTQEKLAELINLSPHYIFEIEKGVKTMSLYTLHDIVTELHTSADYILYGSSTPTEQSYPDQLELLIENVPYSMRETLAEIISNLLPYLK
ncbi:MAG: helix-turn-helix transcriptional regulator [Lachnospira sp.]|nr:helix-turn-helix transcriptional regulator [Lachnospira sp.]